MAWTLSVLPPAARQLAKLDRPVRARIGVAISKLAADPRPAGCKKLVGVDAWRIRMGDWRILYQIRDAQLLALVVRVRHRGDVYE